jgi:FkbM family methyltransferase
MIIIKNIGMRTFFKSLIRVFHIAVSKSEIAVKIYFRALNLLLKGLPDHKFKSMVIGYLLRNYARISWPQIGLAPQKVKVAGSSLEIKLIPHLLEEDLGSLIFKTLSYKKGTFAYLEEHIGDYDAVIEIGANVGLFTICLSKWFSRLGKLSSNIFAFEPSRDVYLRLLKNLKLNGIEGAQTFNLAVGAADGFVDFYEPADCLTNGSLDRDFAALFSTSLNINKTFVVSGHFLEQLVKDSSRVLIIIDAEGAEYAILESMKEFIAKRAPAIIMEALELYQGRLNQLDFLFSGQYSFFNITDTGLQGSDKFMPSKFYNYLLLPRIKK